MAVSGNTVRRQNRKQIMLLRKHEDGIYFIDASGEFTKGHPQNTMEKAHIKTVLDACRMRRNIDKLSHLADNREIEENGYNLNIPRYVDTFEPEEVPNMSEVFDELVSLEKESYEAEKAFFEMMKQLTGTNEEAQKELDTVIEKIQEYLQERNGQLQFIL